MKKFVQSNPVASFIILTFIYSWTLWLFMILSSKGLLPFKFPTNFLGSFGPAFGALIVIGIIDGRKGLKNLFKSLIHWKTSLWAYLFAIFFIISAYVLTILIAYLTDPSLIEFHKLPGLAETIIYFFVIAVLGGPLGEEIGWRGFLQPELLRRFNPFITSIFISIIWFTWHIPLFWLEGAAQKGGSIAFFALSVFVMTFLFTLLYIKSNGSLLLVIIFHTMINYISAFIIPGILPSAETSDTFGHISTYVLSGLAILTFIVYYRTYMTRKQSFLK